MSGASKSELDKSAVCLDCRWKGRIGNMIASDTLRCPKCSSANWHPAERETLNLQNYAGNVGTKN